MYQLVENLWESLKVSKGTGIFFLIITKNWTLFSSCPRPRELFVACPLVLTFSSSPLKPLAITEPNLAGSNYEESFIKIAHLVPVRLQTWLPRADLTDYKNPHLKLLHQMN